MGEEGKRLRPVRQAELHDPARRSRGRPRRAAGRQERLGSHGGALPCGLCRWQGRCHVERRGLRAHGTHEAPGGTGYDGAARQGNHRSRYTHQCRGVSPSGPFELRPCRALLHLPRHLGARGAQGAGRVAPRIEFSRAPSRGGSRDACRTAEKRHPMGARQGPSAEHDEKPVAEPGHSNSKRELPAPVSSSQPSAR